MKINNFARKAYTAYITFGLTPEGACGLMGNQFPESMGFLANKLELLCMKRYKEKGKIYTDISYTQAVDSGKISRAEFLSPMGKHYGYGLSQWTTADRKAGLYDRAKKKGVSIADEDLQIEYVLWELKNRFPKVLQKLKTTKSVQEASDYVLQYYEQPNGWQSMKKTRASYGQTYYKELAGKESAHMISNCGHDENRKYTGGKPGDQKGDEWAIIPWYSRPWTCVLRHPDPAVRKKIADLARKAADNNLIGYCQGHRLTYWEHLKASDYDPSQITVACEADCSSGVSANIRATGILLKNEELQKISVSCTTRNLRKQCDDHGFDVLTDRKYLDSPDYLFEGDILLCEGHHVATNLTTGSKAGETTKKPATNTKPGSLPNSNVKKGQKWLNSCYGATLENYLGEKLKVDGEYGTKSRAAAVCIWKDVVNRKYGTKLDPSNKNFLDSCKKAAKKAMIKQGASGTLAYLVEFILSAKGFYFGKMDASFGTDLTASVKSFQKEKGLDADGIVGANTWYKLFN